MGRHRQQATHATEDGSRRRRGIPLAIGMVACATVVWQSSHATFADATVSSGNTVSAGTVNIDVTNGGAAMFSADSGLAPGVTRTQCIGVTYTGSLTPTSVALYFPNGPTQARESENGGAYSAWQYAPGPEMDDNITLQVQVNNADLASDPGTTCTGTFGDVVPAGTNLRTLINTNNTFGSGYTVPTIGNGQFRSFRFTYTFSALAPNGAQGDGVEFSAAWEAQR